MKVLVIGATGMLGRAIVAALRDQGHRVVALSRSGHPVPGAEQAVRLDVTRLDSWRDWARYLTGMEAVVNVAGTVQQTHWGARAQALDDLAPALLFGACSRRRIQRIIHVSALGVDRPESGAGPDRLLAAKRSGEAALKAQAGEWVILRPALVLGPDAQGIAALLHGLAALPVLPDLPGQPQLQPVHPGDVARTVGFFLRPEAPVRIVVDLAGPERIGLVPAVALVRHWLGWGRARRLPLPGWLAPPLRALGHAGGAILSALGWNVPRLSVRVGLTMGPNGDPSTWTAITGISPRPLGQMLADRPARVQDRWFARMVLLHPLILAVLALFWLGTGLIALTFGFEIAQDYLRMGDMGGMSGPAVWAAALADCAIGIGIALRPTSRRALSLGIALALAYALAGTMILPALWIDPLGPMLKIWPVLLLHLVALAGEAGR